ncbi:hypothetical protein ACHAW6_014000, partial [Cyclotella cf. meneghiniana]
VHGSNVEQRYNKQGRKSAQREGTPIPGKKHSNQRKDSMSFQDVGRSGKRPNKPTSSPNRGGFSAPSSGNRYSGAVGSGSRDASECGGGYEQLSDSILQYQKNVALLEKMSKSVGTPNDTSVLETQYSLQLDIINELGTGIENQLSHLESRLATLPRSEASSSRSTHVKLSRDYRLVEQQFKNVQLDVRKKRALQKAKQNEQIRMEEKRKTDVGGGGTEKSEEVARMQMLIHEDRINEEIMREREEEIRNIHKGMHQVNEIYKDLAHLVDNQQEGIDQIETQMENAKENTATGLKHIEKANAHQQSQCVIS